MGASLVQRKGGRGRRPLRRLLVALGAVLAATAALAGGAGSATAEVTFTDKPPDTVAATDASGALVSYTVDGVNDAGDHVAVSCDHPAGTTDATPFTRSFQAPVGTTTVVCALADDASVSASFSVTVTPPPDTTPPVLADHADVTIAPGTSPAYTLPTATDDTDPSPVVTCTPGPLDPFAAGTTTTVTCTAKDASGNVSAPETFTVTVTSPPNQPPVFSSTPPDLTREATGPSGATVTFTAPTASDPEDGQIASTCSPASGATFALGSTTVTCTATDSDGATATTSFKVSVVDTTPPALTVPADVTVGAASSAGTPASDPTIAAFLAGATATDAVDTSVTITTNAPAVFPLGKTVVTFTARDDAGNKATATASVTVDDTAPPVFGQTPPDLTREATGPDGAVVTYDAPTAVDGGDPVPVTCDPPSGATFPLGVSTVVCTARDASGNTATVSFHVTVVDTTPPALTAPADVSVVAPSSAGVPASNAKIAAFLAGATATDIVDTSVELTTNAPATFRIGKTAVVFTARDDSGNAATATAHVTVLPPGSPPSTGPPPDRTPPADVTKLTATAGDRLVRLSWAPPAKDFDHVVVQRARSDAAAATTQVYSGNANAFVDRGLQNGVEYRYTVVAYDAAGNRSAGAVVVATPKARMLLAPKDGARVSRKRPPTLRWKAYPGARYYNVQVFRVPRSAAASASIAADAKVLSAWPNKARLKLAKKWRYKGRRYSLAKGTYRWYVWPGMGARSAATYGPLLGQQAFVVR